MLQVHALSATDVPEIRDAVRRGIALVVDLVTELSGPDPAAVQKFMAWGQLCHLVVMADLDGIPSSWAKTVTSGIRHY